CKDRKPCRPPTAGVEENWLFRGHLPPSHIGPGSRFPLLYAKAPPHAVRHDTMRPWRNSGIAADFLAGGRDVRAIASLASRIPFDQRVLWQPTIVRNARVIAVPIPSSLSTAVT